MGKNHSVIIQWSEADKVFIATVPELPGLNAYGDTPEDAISELNVAKELFLQVMVEDGEDIPDPDYYSPHSGQLRIRIPKSLHSSLSAEAKKEDVSLNQYICHLLSERNAYQKVKQEIRTSKQLVIVEQKGAFTSGISWIEDVSIQLPSSSSAIMSVYEGNVGNTPTASNKH